MINHPILTMPVPRSIRKRCDQSGEGARLGCSVVFLVPFACVALVLTALLGWALAVALVGRDVDATVTRLWTTPGSRRTTTYHVACRYAVDGQPSTCEMTAGEAVHGGLREGSTFRIRRLAVGPWETRLASGDVTSRVVLYFWTTALACTILAFLGWTLWGSDRVQRHLVAWGVVVPGTVGAKTRRTVKGNEVCDVAYDFTWPTGEPAQGVMTVLPEVADTVGTGQEVVVLVRVGFPRLSAVLELCRYECAS